LAAILLTIGCGTSTSTPRDSQPAADSAADSATDSTTDSTVDSAADSTEADGDPAEQYQQTALAARDELFKRLSTRLMSAMAQGGPTAAIPVCREEAPKIAADVGQEFGVAIGRTSWKLRNSQNQPPAWATPLVEQRVAEAQFLQLEDGRHAALLPIRLKAQCLACHGPDDQISPQVRDSLAANYPDDEATGFADGDLRGWFWVEVPAGDAAGEDSAGERDAAGDEPVGSES
jgi:hypothetical protein